MHAATAAEASTAPAGAAVGSSMNSPQIAKALIALLALLQVRETQGMELTPNYEELAPRGLAVDRTLLTTTWMMLGVLVLVVVWEGVKWTLLTTTRKARRLLRLREQAASAVQREMDRFDRDRQVIPPPPEGDHSRSHGRLRDHQSETVDPRASTTRSTGRQRARQASSASSAIPEGLEETFVRGLYARRERGRYVEGSCQTDPWEPQPRIVEVPVRVEVPIEVPAREAALLGDFTPVGAELVVSQFGEHLHTTTMCEGLRKSTSRLRTLVPCLHCFGNSQLFMRQRAFRRLRQGVAEEMSHSYWKSQGGVKNAANP